jgi:D-3-phosphoglycerate dehydrogenase
MKGSCSKVTSYRILNAEPDHYSSEAENILKLVGEVHGKSLTRGQLLECLADFDVLIVRLGFQVDQEMIDHGLRLKAIVSATTGLDHIDVAYAQGKGIRVLSLRGEYDFLRNIPATAEHTWGLLLSLIRFIPSAFQSVLDGEWERDLFRGRDLAGKRLGILGLGRIGEKIARYGLAFSMNVYAYDPYRQGWVDGVQVMQSQSALLEVSQIFTIHVPLSDQTRLLIGKDELEHLPHEAVLINTARGEILAEAALLESLESGRLAGAAIDVIWNERSIEGGQSKLLDYARQHRNLIITPHIGGATFESMAMTEVFMAHKLSAFLCSLNSEKIEGK